MRGQEGGVAAAGNVGVGVEGSQDCCYCLCCGGDGGGDGDDSDAVGKCCADVAGSTPQHYMG